jgi:hypothetical protein
MGVRPAGDAGGIGNTNAVSSGRYMREDRVGAQANSASSRAIRWMIRTTMLGVEGKLPAVENRSTLSCMGTISSTPVWSRSDGGSFFVEQVRDRTRYRQQVCP